jgi:beta-lactamase regulating signal transducer with metallopeptidase domain/membrane peptidoglycan carboxypeptidase
MNMTPLLELLSHTAMKGAAVLLVALLMGLILRKTAASRRYAIWITAIVALALLPLAMWVLPAWRVLPKAAAELEWPALEPERVSESVEPMLEWADVSSPVSKSVSQPVDRVEALPAFAWKISWQEVMAALPVVWMLIAGALLLRLGWSAWSLRRLETALHPGESEMLVETARELGLKRVPRLRVGPADAVPMVWGVLKPRLLLPEGFEAWSHEKQRGVLLHELAHLQRGDPLALWIAQWVKALHWFNPLSWLTLHQLRADQERACDDAVLRHGVRASDYAQSLLDLSRHQRLAPGLSLCALTITRCAPVEARVKAILDPRCHREGLTLRWLAGLTGCALLITLPVAMLHAIEDSALRGRILDRHGRVLAESTKEKTRHYPLKTLAAHMVGYHGQTKAAGMEKQHNAELAAGKDVTLTLDMRLQSLALRAMTEAGVTRGAAVVLDPRTGEVLAAVSLPSYDPNQFVPVIDLKSWDALLKDAERPMLSRCLKGFSPGSTFKVLIGLAGGAAGISAQKFNCTGSVTYGSKAMGCWIKRQNGGGHGMLGMRDSLAVSCNCYWYQFGNLAGIDQIESMGRTIGFGSAYGITDEEDKGILPGPAWLKQFRPGEKWSEGYTANTSIGQGFVLATPLQMAVLAATVGNGGRVPQPGIVKQQEPGAWRADLTQGTLTAADVAPLREGMRLAVKDDSGTGKPARSDKIVIAGKTGTAQNWRTVNGEKVESNHGWFIGFAPYDKPTLAFAILKQGAKSGGGDCGPIAKRIVEEALALPADGSGEALPVEEDLRKLKQAQAPSGTPANDADIIMDPQLAGSWKLLQRKGHLADLPAQAVTTPPKPGNVTYGTLPFQFTAPREAAQRWLAASLGDVIGKYYDKAQPWPVKPGVFDYTYEGFGDCMIHIKSLDAETMEVRLWWSPKAPKRILIAPDEATPPAPKTAAPKELSGVASSSTQKAAPATAEQPDLDVAEVSRQIRVLVKQTGIDMSRLKAGEGKIFIVAVSDGMDEALLFRDRLIELGKQWQVTWEVTKPQKVPDRPKMMFMAVGTYRTAPIKAAAPTALASSVKTWDVLQKFGKLANLPAGAVPDRLTQTESFVVPSIPTLKFAFIASREAVYEWLSASLPSKKLEWQADKLRELGGSKPFRHDFWIHDNCWVRVECEIARARVLVYRRNMILIAPDESQEPQPKGKLELDYKREGITSTESAMPTLNVALQTLRATIPPNEVKRPPSFVFFAPAIKLHVQTPASPSILEVALPAPLQHLAGVLGTASEKDLLRGAQLRHHTTQFALLHNLRFSVDESPRRSLQSPSH